MREPSIVAASVLGLVLVSGCASTSNPKPAVCDGKRRRPANPYGTVLPAVPLPGSAPMPTDAAAKPPPVPAAPGPLSAIDPLSLLPCGRPA